MYELKGTLVIWTIYDVIYYAASIFATNRQFRKKTGQIERLKQPVV